MRNPEAEHANVFDGPETMPTEPDGWWEAQRARFIRRRVEALVGKRAQILDVGCGRATMFQDADFATSFVVQADSHPWPEWRDGAGFFVRANADALPFREGSFDLVGSFDVIEHLDDDVGALVEQRRVTSADGYVVAAVPADPRLWSAHDEAVGHHRRYTPDALSDTAESAGLAVTYITHFFSYLWLPARLMRKASVRRSPDPPGRVGSTIVAAAMGALGILERAVLSKTTLPFGSSLLVETRYPGAAVPSDSPVLASRSGT